MTSSKPTRRRNVGRPRDHSIHAKACTATLNLYNEVGFKGLSFGAVAREAGIGKAAIYSRWDSIEDLLVESLGYIVAVPEDADTGSVEKDLRALAASIWRIYTAKYGFVSVRVSLDSMTMPHLSKAYRRLGADYRDAASRIVDNGIQRGEVLETASSVVILDLLIGGILVHLLAMPDVPRPQTDEIESLLAALVDNILHGVSTHGRD